MQTDLSLRIEKIWAMADIALAQGFVDYGADGDSSTASVGGLTFKFTGDTLSRVRGPHLDVAIVHHKPQLGVTFFPGTETIVQFLRGDDDVLSRAYEELSAMQKIFTAKKAA